MLISEKKLRDLIRGLLNTDRTKDSPEHDQLALFMSPDDEGIVYSSKAVKENINDILSYSLGNLWFSENVIKAVIGIESPPDNAPCAGAWQISHIAGPGYGKIIYGLGYALSPMNKIMATRSQDSSGKPKITSSAMSSWEKTFKSQRGRIRLDDIDAPREKKITPDDETDDCFLHDPNSAENPVNFAYELQGWEITMKDRMLKEDKVTVNLIEKKFGPDAIQEFRRLLQEGSDFFWKKNYFRSSSP